MLQAPGGAHPHISVVSPVYRCAPCIERLVDEVAANVSSLTDSFEVILVDDGSPDNAWATIESLAQSRPWLRGLRLSRNFGQHAAISAGIAHGRGEWTVVLDCDLQDPPSAIPDLYRRATTGGYDVVFAQRVNRQDRAAKRLSSWAFYKILTWLTGVQQNEQVANFGIFRRPVIDSIVAMPEHSRAFPLMVRWTGFNATEIPVEHAARAHGRTSYTFGQMIRLASHMVLGYSDKPLRWVAYGGVASSGVAFLLAAYAVVMLVQGSTSVAGWTSLVSSIWLLGGLTLLSLGLVGLYVGEIFRNVQGRPSSIVSEVVIGQASPPHDGSSAEPEPTEVAIAPESRPHR